MTAARAGTTTAFAGYLTLAVASLGSLAVGFGLDAGLVVAGGVIAAVSFVWAARNAEGHRTVDHVAAGVGLVVGVGVLVPTVASALWDLRLGTLCLAFGAVFFAGSNGLTRLFDGTLHESRRVAFVAAAVPAVALGVAVVVWVFVQVGELFVGVRSVTTFTLLIALEVQVIAAAGLLNVAAATVDQWVGETDGDTETALVPDVDAVTANLERFYPSTGRPETIFAYVFLFVQVFLALTVPGMLDSVLSSVPGLGPAVVLVLQSEWLHVLFDGLIVLSLLVLGVEGLRRVVVTWAAPDPAETLGYAAGSAGAVALLVLASVLPLTGAVVASAVPGVGPVPSVAVALGGLCLVLAALLPAFFGITAVGRLTPAPDETTGFALSATLLFLGAVGAGLAGAVPPLVFAVAAAAFVVWDAGATGTELAGTLGLAADTERGEFVLTATTTLVGIGAVVLATVALYALGPLSVSIPAWRGYLAMLLALVALTAFALYLVRSSG